MILCTNLRRAPITQALEDEFGVPVYDSIANVACKSLQLVGGRYPGGGRHPAGRGLGRAVSGIGLIGGGLEACRPQ